jgi:hypothetical protein
MADVTPEVRAKILRMLEEARREIAAEVASTDWQRHHQPKLLAAIEDHIRRFGEGAARELKADLNTQFAEGQRAVDAELAGKGISVGLMPDISTSALGAMQQDLGTRITNLTADAARQIQKELSLGLLGGKTPFETMEAIGRNLSDAGRFSSIARRAEVIVKEEFGRVFRAGEQQRRSIAAKHVSGLKKRWVHAGHPAKPRPTHVALHGKVVNVDEPFELLNPKTGAIERPMHPKDPILSAENTIGCGCQAQTYKESWNLDLPKAV